MMTRTMAALAIVGAALPALAQEPPTIHTSAQAVVTVPAASAHLVVGATATSTRAGDAGARVAAIVNAVRDALAGLGIDRDDLVTAGYTVNPVYDDRGSPSRYTAVSSVSVDVTDLDQLGSIVDTALGAGATNVSQLSFEAASPERARARAIEEAFARAREDADTLARAAGGRLGPPLSLSTDQGGRGFSEPVMMRAAAVGTQLPSPEVTISASVSVDWRLD
jgi:uncharacterized protein